MLIYTLYAGMSVYVCLQNKVDIYLGS